MKHIYLESCESTNAVAKSLIERYQEPFCVRTSYQTKGKGTMGKSFHSPKDKGLYMSLVLYEGVNIENIHDITLNCAHIISQYLNDTYKIETYVKAPNDIYIEGKKLCGILTESSLSVNENTYDAIIIGIGLNLIKDTNLPSDIASIYTALSEHTTQEIHLNQVLEDLLHALPY